MTIRPFGLTSPKRSFTNLGLHTPGDETSPSLPGPQIAGAGIWWRLNCLSFIFSFVSSLS